MRNIAEVDWRVGTQHINARLLEPVWAEIFADFKEASLFRRKEILTMVEGAAVFQPREALTIAEYAMRHPVENVTSREAQLKFGSQMILGHVAQILRQVAHHRDFLSRSVRLLWDLGRDNTEPLNSSPGHPFRLLCELARPRRHKPVGYQLAVVNTAIGLLKDSDVHDHVHSVLDIMQAGLSRQGMDVWSEDAGSFKMDPYTVPHDAVTELHERALEVVFECLSSAQPKVVLRAAKVLIEQARPMASGMLGQTITAEQQEAWKAERLRALQHLKNVAATTSEPIVALEIRNGVDFLSRASKDADIRYAAGDVVAVVDARKDLQDVDVLMDSWGHHQHVYDAAGKQDFEQSRQQNEERLSAAAGSFIGRFTPDAFAQFFNDQTQRARALELKFSPERLIWHLARRNSTYAESLLRYIFAHPDEPIAGHARDLFMNLTSDAILLARRAIAIGDTQLACAAAVLLSVDREWATEEQALFGSLIAHPDPAVRAQTLGCLSFSLKHNKEVIFAALTSLAIGGSSLVAKELGELFNEHHEPVASIPTQILIGLLPKLIDVPDLSDYQIEAFISEAFVLAPEATVDMFLARIEHRDLHEDMDASAVPYEFGVDLQRLGAHPSTRRFFENCETQAEMMRRSGGDTTFPSFGERCSIRKMWPRATF